MARSTAATSVTVPSSVEALTQRLPRPRGSRLARALLRAAGWTLVFDGLPARQGVLVAYPHTSNWDFVVGVLAKWALGLPVAFWGKDSLFRVPVFGRWLRWVGGVPVDRSGANGIVGDMVARFEAARQADAFLWLALAPEGTRSFTPYWRSGFYQVTVQAGVPLGLAFFDYRRRRVGIMGYLRLSGDRAADLAAIAAAYADVQGRRPDLAAPVTLREDRTA